MIQVEICSDRLPLVSSFFLVACCVSQSVRGYYQAGALNSSSGLTSTSRSVLSLMILSSVLPLCTLETSVVVFGSSFFMNFGVIVSVWGFLGKSRCTLSNLLTFSACRRVFGLPGYHLLCACSVCCVP